MDSERRIIGRFAPTPTRYLHGGNILCALIAYLAAKSKGGKFLIRIEDLDKARCPDAAATETLEALAFLGITSDEEPIYQSRRTEAYERALGVLSKKVIVYPCFCTRAQLHAAEAPRGSDGVFVYDGACRDLTPEEIAAKTLERAPCLRVRVPDERVSFVDGVAGEYAQDLAKDCGDFILRRSDGVFAYQLAVTVDDGECGVTQVVRGNDLLSSAPRQIWLQRLLGYATPEYYHIPLVCDANGRKLSKSEGDDARKLFERFSPNEILGGLAFAAGILPMFRAASLDELIEKFDFGKIRRDKIYLPEEFTCGL